MTEAETTRKVGLQLQDLSKTFADRSGQGEMTAVDDITLDIYEGEFVTLLGPSGCGKTTTLRLIAGFEMPSAGRIILDGKDVGNRPPNKRDMALVFQSYALFQHMSVFDNVAYGLQVRGRSRRETHQRVEDSLELVGLEGLGDRRPNELSGGQQQRVALARALIVEPRVLLFDEPLSNLDAKLRVQMRSEILALHNRLNITSVYVTHDQVEAMALSDRIVVMNAEHIEQIDKPKQIYRRPRTRFVADFIGRANFVETEVQAVSNGDVTVDLLGRTTTRPMAEAPPVGDTLTALLRPEGLKLRPDANLQQVRVIQAMYLGAEIEYVVEVDEQRFTVVENDPRASHIFEEGQTVGLDFVDETVHLMLEQV